jgi:tape measure domain-containing protein
MAAGSEERLMVMLEARITDFERKMRQAEQRGTRTYQGLQRGSRTATRQMSGDMSRIGGLATAAAASILSIGAAMNKVRTSSDGYKTIINQLRSIGQESDAAVDKLLAVAVRSRAPIEDLATSVARIQKATGDSYDVTLRRAETLNKILAVGGSTAAEVSSVVTQLSQALSAGALMGDEFASLREAAPVELLDAIAAAMGTTRDKLKELSSEGAITADVVTKALDSMAESADANFAKTAQTTGQAMTNINSALTTFIGRVDEGTGASDTMIAALNNLATWLVENADEATALGQSLGAMFDVANERVGEFMALIDGMADALREGFDAEPMEGFGDAIQRVIDFIADMNGVIEGSAAVAREAFLNIGDSVAAGLNAAINAVIGAVESMVNTVMAGVRRVAGAIDAVTSAMPGTEGTNLAAGVHDVKLDRLDPIPPGSSGKPLAEVYTEARDAGTARVIDAMDEANRDYGGRLAGRQIADQTPLQLGLPPITPPATTAPGTAPGGSSDALSTGGSAGGGRRGRTGRAGGRQESPFFGNIEQDLTNLERQISLIGKSNEEVATAQARWEMLDEAKKRGIPVNEELSAQINTQAEQFGRLTGELERAEIAQQQFDQAVDGIAGAFADALAGGESLREGLANVFQQIANDLIKSGIQNMIASLFNGGSGGGGGGGGWAGAILGAIGGFFGGGKSGPSFATGGFTGMGGKHDPAGIVHRGEYVMSAQAVQRLGVGKLDAMHKSALRGYASGGPVGVSAPAAANASDEGKTTIMVELSPDLTARILDQARGQSVKISQETAAAQAKALPSQIQRAQANPRRR